MNFVTMEYFLAVANKRNFTKAAEELHITQQTLSAHIANLEKELDCQLIVRSKPLELTYEGEIFFQHAANIYDSWQCMWNEFNDLTYNQRGKLLVGINFTRSQAIMPYVIENFHKSYPNIEVRIIEGVHDTIHQNLFNRDIDIAIARFPHTISGIKIEDFYQEEIVMCVPNKFMELVTEEVGDVIEDLSPFKNCPFLLGNNKDISGQICLDMIERANFLPTVRVRSNNIETLMQCCMKGEGICFCQKSLVPATLHKKQLENVRIFSLKPRLMASTYNICFGYRENSYQWKIISEFIRIAVETSRSFGFF